MRYSSQVKPISYLKANAAEVLAQLSEQREPLVITQNGEAKAVLQDVASFEETQATLALLKILALGSQEVEAGRVKPVADVVERLRAQPFANAFQRAPGIAESVEWAKALVALDTLVIDPEVVADTAGILFKQREDIAAITPLLDDLLAPSPTVL